MSNISDLDYDTETGPHVAPSHFESGDGLLFHKFEKNV